MNTLNNTDLLTAHSLMVADLKKSGKAILDSLTPDKCDVLHMAIGVAGEAGELLDAIKKFVVYNKPIDRENVIEELGDLEFYMEGLRQNLGITREQCLQHNLNKLMLGKQARYAKGVYSDEAAQARTDKVISPPAPTHRPRILILGHGRHGKDTVAMIINYFTGLTFIASSWFAAKEVVFPALSEDYVDITACYEDRANKRTKWFELIKAYNTPDATRLARALLKESNIYVGMRSNAEYEACMKAGLFDYVFWVDASHRAPLESVTSFNIPYNKDTMIYIDNNIKGSDGDLTELERTVKKVLVDYTSLNVTQQA